jgi:cytoskeletal protein CcmA (bactofilin family)
MFGLGSRIDTLVGQGCEFKGQVTVDGGIVVDGRVEGNITATERITVGVHGQVRGNLTAPEVVVGGRVQGLISASGRAELLAGAHIDGDIRAARLTMADGAVLTGKVGMEAPAAAESAEYKFARK